MNVLRPSSATGDRSLIQITGCKVQPAREQEADSKEKSQKERHNVLLSACVSDVMFFMSSSYFTQLETYLIQLILLMQLLVLALH